MVSSLAEGPEGQEPLSSTRGREKWGVPNPWSQAALMRTQLSHWSHQETQKQPPIHEGLKFTISKCNSLQDQGCPFSSPIIPLCTPVPSQETRYMVLSSQVTQMRGLGVFPGPLLTEAENGVHLHTWVSRPPHCAHLSPNSFSSHWPLPLAQLCP